MHLKTVSIREVGLRDGLQNEPAQPVEKRIQLGCLLLQARVSILEACSFTGPKMLGMSQPGEVFQGLSAIRIPSQTVGALVMTSRDSLTKYVDAALAAGVSDMAFVLSAHREHCQRNLGATPDELMARYETLFHDARMQSITRRIYISTCWGDKSSDDVSIDQVYDLLARCLAIGITEVGIADTSALGTPDSIHERFEKWQRMGLDLARTAFHPHDPDWQSGRGVANLLAAYHAGIRRLDTSILGLGGCPATAHPHGNVSTEDAVEEFERLGIRTGIDMTHLLLASNYGINTMQLPVYSRAAQFLKRPSVSLDDIL